MKRVVIKIGSSTLVKDGKVDAVFVGHLASECANLMHDEDIQPIIVSSGSIALGLEVLGIHGERPDDMPTLQAAASIGQVGLIRQYTDTFACFGVTVGQILMTRATTGQRESYLHARDTIERLLELGVVPHHQRKRHRCRRRDSLWRPTTRSRPWSRHPSTPTSWSC